MAGTAILGRLSWLPAKVVSKRDETSRVRSIVFECPMWDGHMPGQHVDVRLTAEDGYQAQRSYSIASGPDDDHLMLTIERLQDGEVSPYLFDELQPGDELEMRGPIGRFFVWEPTMTGPLLMVAGGTGVVPFRAMIRHRAALGSTVPVRLLYSSRTQDDVVYRDELGHAPDGVDVRFTLTRSQPDGWRGYRGRIDRDLLSEAAWPIEAEPQIYVCGPSGLVEVVANSLVGLGYDMEAIRTERFGPTGT